MRKMILTEYVTLDGVMEDPVWTMPYWNEEIAQYKRDELFASDALLLGRVTYQGFAADWPARTDEDGFAERMNSMRKYVVSTSLQELTWNNSQRLQGNVPEEVAKLKRQPGQNILIYGSGKLAATLMRHALIDEYRLLFYPVVQGSGKRLFQDGNNKKLKLVETRTFRSGVIALIYQATDRPVNMPTE
jgi:dihydrofolate reductase